MRLLGKLGLAAAACLLWANSAAADTTVKWLHIEANPAQVKIWEEVARAYEASHPGTKIEMQFLENEAYKAKLPTILQSKDRPNIIYSWAGGVLKTQIEAGVLDDITDQVKGYSDSLTPAALAAFTANGRVYGLPTALSQVGFLCNKELMAKAKVDPAGIKSWDDLLAAVKTLKAAGVTPIVVGGADKWPLHFYWTHLAVRVGGKPAFDAALRGENGGFAGETFQKSGELFKQLVDLQPFQNGFLGFKNPQAVGYFGDGKAAMTLAISHRLSSAACACRRQGRIERRQDLLVRLPGRGRRQGRANRYAWRHHRLADHQGLAEGGRRFPEILRLQGRADAACCGQLHHPGGAGRGCRSQQRLHEADRGQSGEVELPPELL